MKSPFGVYKFLIASFILFSSLSGCKKDKPDFNDGCYPPEIADIIVRNCATSGCHNTASKDAAAGLDLSSWETMFQGNRNGAVTVPYRADQSTLFYFINTDPSLGIVQSPTMPFNASPLSQAEVITIRDWINNGAPNCEGQIKFTDNPNRRKFYVANQGCDLVGVHDAATKVVMRYVNVGNSSAIESPHMIKVSPDGNFWYVIFINSSVMQKYRTSDDTFVAQANISQGAWNTFTMSDDGTRAWVVDFSATGRVAYVNLETMQLLQTYTDPGFFTSPHGSVVNSTSTTLYITSQTGNKIYKWDITNPLLPDYEEITINTGGANADAHEIAFSPDGSKYFITCQGRNEVRVFDASDDSFITAIPTATKPLEMAFSQSKGYLFVSCETSNAVTVINYNNLSAIKNITVGYEPHGLAVDEVQGQVYVGNRNTPSSGGPTPHHTSTCGGRNGYLTIIDLNSLNLVSGFKMELSVDPYSISVRN